MDSRRLSDIGIDLRITGIIQSGMLQEYSQITKNLELDGYKISSFFAAERCSWIKNEESQQPIGLDINFTADIKEEFFKVLKSQKELNLDVKGWNVAEIFFFILILKAKTEKQAIVIMCFTTDLGETWDLPEEGGFLFSITTKEGRKINFESPKL
ncbi:MAG: hypothetical protein ACFFDT_14090 [Candidatus Hodarchaeota archaeon]